MSKSTTTKPRDLAPRIRRPRDPNRHKRSIEPATGPREPRTVTAARVTRVRVDGSTGRPVCRSSWSDAVDAAVDAVKSRKPNGARIYTSATVESTRRIARTGRVRTLTVRQVPRREARRMVAASLARRDALLRDGAASLPCASWHGAAATCARCSPLPPGSPARPHVTPAHRLADSTLLRFVAALRKAPAHVSRWDSIPAPARSLGTVVAPLSRRESDAIDARLAATSPEYRALLDAKRQRRRERQSA